MNNSENKDREQGQNDKEALKPDGETLNTTDPQKNMEGPFSSTMHGTGKAFETSETKEEADNEKDEKI